MSDKAFYNLLMIVAALPAVVMICVLIYGAIRSLS